MRDSALLRDVVALDRLHAEADAANPRARHNKDKIALEKQELATRHAELLALSRMRRARGCSAQVLPRRRRRRARTDADAVTVVGPVVARGRAGLVRVARPARETLRRLAGTRHRAAKAEAD